MFWKNIASMYRFAKSSWRRRGIVYTITLAWKELWFEGRYHVETIELVPLEAINDVEEKVKESAVHYQATYVHTFHRLLKELDTIDYNQGFLDLGCGKGRALMLAACAGFENIIGVEFSKALVDVCNKNLEAFSKVVSSSSFEVIHGDAGKYLIPDTVGFVYMANPFSEDIIKEVLKNIDASLERSSRSIIIGYTTPIYADLILSHGYVKIVEQKDPAGAFTAIAYRKCQLNKIEDA
jgi:SAM-dependent methyltransferase